MAQAAYELENFAPRVRKATPRVRVAKREKSARRVQVMKMVRILLAVALVVALVCAVLYTQAQLTAVQGDIATKKKELKDEETLNFYLSFELDNMTSLKNIEDKAVGMGLEKTDNTQVTYYRVDDGNDIQVRENPLLQWLERLRLGLLNIVEYLTP